MNKGYYGKFGGIFIPETLSFALRELDTLYQDIKNDTTFNNELQDIYIHYVGRPSPLYLSLIHI